MLISAQEVFNGTLGSIATYYTSANWNTVLSKGESLSIQVIADAGPISGGPSIVVTVEGSNDGQSWSQIGGPNGPIVTLSPTSYPSNALGNTLGFLLPAQIRLGVTANVAAVSSVVRVDVAVHGESTR